MFLKGDVAILIRQKRSGSFRPAEGSMSKGEAHK
jgi:hypothetical protein